MPDDAYQAALRGGLSAAMPKEAAAKKKKKAAAAAAPTAAESDGVKAARALLSKMEAETGNSPSSVTDAYKVGLSAAAKAAAPTKEEKEKLKAEQEKAAAEQAKSWLEGKSEEEKQDMIKKAMSGGLSSAAVQPKPKKESKEEDKKGPAAESDGVKAARALLAKMEAEESVHTPSAVSDAYKVGLSAAVQVTAPTKEEKEKLKAEQEKAVAEQAKSWLEGKSEEEKQAMIKKAMSGGLSSAAAKPKPKKKEKKQEDEEPLPSSVEVWLEKMKAESEGEGGDVSAAVKAALSGGASTAAGLGTSITKSKKEKAPVDPIPPGVRQWIEANSDTPKWEEEAGDAVTAAMYGGGIASYASRGKKKVAPKPKEEDELVPKSIQRWLENNKNDIDEPEETVAAVESSLCVPPEVAKFLQEANEEYSADEVTAALNSLMT